MSSGCCQHIPVPLKEQMVLMHWVHQLSQSKVAQLMDIHQLTMHHAVKKMRKTGWVTGSSAQSGQPRVLNGVDCAISTILYACAKYPG